MPLIVSPTETDTSLRETSLTNRGIASDETEMAVASSAPLSTRFTRFAHLESWRLFQSCEDIAACEQEDSSEPEAEGTVPKLEGCNIVDPAITELVRKLVETYWAIVVSRALQSRFPLTKTSIAVVEDPEEKERIVTLRVLCKSTALQALAFWDSLEPDIERWLETLSEYEQSTVNSRLALRIHWR